jgi:phospholipase A1
MTKMHRHPDRTSLPWLALTICLIAINRVGLAADAANISRCASITDDHERLQCYDATGGPTEAEPLQQSGGVVPLKPVSGTGSPTALSVRWELEPETKQGLWALRPHQPTFFLPLRYSNRTNDSPQTPSQPVSASVPLDNTEAEFQFSLKLKAGENLLGSDIDMWLGYTQQSQWQVYNGEISRPFRETDYQPEVFFSLPTRYDFLGLTGRFINLGLVHQSNGRAEPLSRSWNRVYAQFGFERRNFALLVRPWYRLKEDAPTDNNPDIVHYMGHGDVTAIYQSGRHQFSLLGRYNNGVGALQGTWSFPIQGRLMGYVKAFSGYGETLIDYNWNQTTIGVGILLIDWL